MEMVLDKKQIWTIFLIQAQMSHKAEETTHNINTAFGPETTNDCTVRWWFKKFCKGDESLADKEWSAQISDVDNNQLRAITEADPLTTTQEAVEELIVDHSMIVQYVKQTGKVKKLGCFEESSSLILCNNSERFLDHTVTCNKKWTAYDNQQWPAQGMDGEEAPKRFPKPNLRSQSSFGSLLPVWSTIAFWIPAKSLHLEKYA